MWGKNILLRSIADFKKVKKYIYDKMELDDIIQPHQEKAIKLWKDTIVNTNTNMVGNFYGTRQLENNNILIILQPNDRDMQYNMSIFSSDADVRFSYDIKFNHKTGDKLADFFDDEITNRMKKAKDYKTKSIEDDIDKIIKKIN